MLTPISGEKQYSSNSLAQKQYVSLIDHPGKKYVSLIIQPGNNMFRSLVSSERSYACSRARGRVNTRPKG